MALYHVSQGSTVIGRLNQLYEQFGYHQEIQVSRYFKGRSGRAVMSSVMERLRTEPPTEMAGSVIVTIRDLLEHTTLDVATGHRVRDIDLPTSNVLQFICADHTVVSVRPSGTEPKIKFYASACADPGSLDEGRRITGAKIDRISDWIEEQIASAER
jgi:phosphoglucomutase